MHRRRRRDRCRWSAVASSASRCRRRPRAGFDRLGRGARAAREARSSPPVTRASATARRQGDRPASRCVPRGARDGGRPCRPATVPDTRRLRRFRGAERVAIAATVASTSGRVRYGTTSSQIHVVGSVRSCEPFNASSRPARLRSAATRSSRAIGASPSLRSCVRLRCRGGRRGRRSHPEVRRAARAASRGPHRRSRPDGSPRPSRHRRSPRIAGRRPPRRPARLARRGADASRTCSSPIVRARRRRALPVGAAARQSIPEATDCEAPVGDRAPLADEDCGTARALLVHHAHRIPSPVRRNHPSAGPARPCDQGVASAAGSRTPRRPSIALGTRR
jgi:hypothetical protein